VNRPGAGANLFLTFGAGNGRLEKKGAGNRLQKKLVGAISKKFKKIKP
jgi:hypothetical protein